ncbi:hypothetical protein LTR53_000048 [Teratosphaeriaceae sp. CCFEE 6253]|nr:hypothetical protein LTR53_000048 [Teratosphaeriaceae sp. CCFEE 6253]
MYLGGDIVRERKSSLPSTVARWLSDGRYQVFWPRDEMEHFEQGLQPTPANTFGDEQAMSSGLDATGISECIDHSERIPAIRSALDERLRDYESSLSSIDVREPEPDPPPADREAEQNRHPTVNLPVMEEEDDERSSPPPRNIYTRSSSAPAKPLKSALSPPHSPPGETRSSRKKRARFQDDPSRSDLSLRRTSTAPAEYGAASALSWSGDPAEYSHGIEQAGSEEEVVDVDERLGSIVVEMQIDVVVVEDRDSDVDTLADGAEDAGADMLEDAGGGDPHADSDDADIEDAGARVCGAAVDKDPDEEAAGGPSIEGSEVQANEVDAEERDLSPDVEGAEARVQDLEAMEAQSDADKDETTEFASDRATQAQSPSPSVSEGDEEGEESTFLTPDGELEDREAIALTVEQPAAESSDLDLLGVRAGERAAAEDAELDFIMPLISIGETEEPDPPAESPPHAPVLARRRSDLNAPDRVDPAASTPGRRRSSSLTNLPHPANPRLKPRPLAAKTTPAHPALTACSMRAAESSPRLNTVYAHPGAAYFSRRATAAYGRTGVKTAQTVVAGPSTYQILWEESPPLGEGDSDSDTTLLEEPGVSDDDEGGEPPPILVASAADLASSPMGRAKTKLAAWSWACEHPDESEGEGAAQRSSSRTIPLMRVDADARRERSEDPPGPPNTEKHSAASSTRHSGPQTPGELTADGDAREEGEDGQGPEGGDEADADADEEDDQPMELRFRSALHRLRSASLPASTEYLAIPSSTPPTPPPPASSSTRVALPTGPLPRALSNLAADEAGFHTHRDSLDLSHGRLARELRVNHHLMTTKDSFLLARGKGAHRYPRLAGPSSSAAVQGAAGVGLGPGRARGLSPIPDASPPEDGGRRTGDGLAALADAVALRVGPGPGGGHIRWAGQGRPERGEGEGEKWYKAMYMRSEGGVLSLRLLEEEVEDPITYLALSFLNAPSHPTPSVDVHPLLPELHARVLDLRDELAVRGGDVVEGQHAVAQLGEEVGAEGH